MPADGNIMKQAHGRGGFDALTLRLPRLFIEDRRERDLACAFRRWSGNTAICTPSIELAKDMLADALYQYDGTDAAGYGSLRRSCKRAASILSAAIAKAEGR